MSNPSEERGFVCQPTREALRAGTANAPQAFSPWGVYSTLPHWSRQTLIHQSRLTLIMQTGLTRDDGARESFPITQLRAFAVMAFLRDASDFLARKEERF